MNSSASADRPLWRQSADDIRPSHLGVQACHHAKSRVHTLLCKGIARGTGKETVQGQLDKQLALTKRREVVLAVTNAVGRVWGVQTTVFNGQGCCGARGEGPPSFLLPKHKIRDYVGTNSNVITLSSPQPLL